MGPPNASFEGFAALLRWMTTNTICLHMQQLACSRPLVKASPPSMSLSMLQSTALMQMELNAACRLIEYPEIIANRIECRTFIALMFAFALAVDASYIAPTCKQAPYFDVCEHAQLAHALTQTRCSPTHIINSAIARCRNVVVLVSTDRAF